MKHSDLPEEFILWIDDDGLLMGHPMENLRNAGIECRMCQDLDRALEIVEQHSDRVSLMLIDVMMPPAKCLKGYDTRDGFESGLRFIDYMVEKGIAMGVKKIVYTNAPVSSPYKPLTCKTGEEQTIKVVKKGKHKGLRFPKFVLSEIGKP